MIKFRCSNCNKKFGVPDDYAGRRIRCNTCDHHTIVPKQSTANPTTAPSDPISQKTGDSYRFSADQMVAATEQLVASKPSEDGSEADGDFVLILPALSSDEASNEREPMELSPESQPVEMQLQSFRNYPAPETDGPAPTKPVTKKTLAKILNRCRPAANEGRTESILNILSYISCIGPVFFILIIFSVFFIISHTDSPRAIHPPFAVPDTGLIKGPVSFLAAFPAIRYTFYAFAFGISPIALITAMVLVFKYCYDMPKTLYFSIVIHGLIFFTIFRG